MALTDVASLKQFTGITTDDTLFDILLPAVEATVKKYLDRDIESTSYVDYYGGNWSRVLLLTEYPVTSITEVKEDQQGGAGSISGSFSSTTALTSGTHYFLDKPGRNSLAEVGRLIRIDDVWAGWWRRQNGLLAAARAPSIGTIKVTYTAGYAAGSIPRDIQLAVWLLCAQVRRSRRKGWPEGSESLAEYSYSLLNAGAEPQIGEARQLLSRWRRLRHRIRVVG